MQEHHNYNMSDTSLFGIDVRPPGDNSHLRATSILPSTNVEVLLAIHSDHDRAIGELAASQCRERLLRRLGSVVLDVDLANTVALAAAACRAWHLDLKNRAVLGTFFLDVLEDFCDG